MIVVLTLALGAGLLLFAAARLTAGAGELQTRIQTYAALPRPADRRPGSRQRSRLARLRLRLNVTLSALNSEALALQLTQAAWRMTVTEFVLIRISSTLAGMLLGLITSGSLLPGLGLALIAYLIPGVLLRRRISRRQIAFEKRLVDVLVLVTGAVRAGFSLLQAMEVVVKEMKPPASEEFQRALRETSLGLSLPRSLRNLAVRMDNADLDLMVTAVEIQYQVGGNLATMLTVVTETIRERVRLLGEVRVLTTQQRYTGYLLSVLPFFIGAMLFIMNPTYMMRLFEPGPILCIPIGALLGIVLGHLSIQRIARIEV
ncbi:MAG TPA: type II secretion system F family protein [Anaerolineales bacterium]|nr:type II secretion system F family protein [Anaerolineales bacterium]